MKLTKSALILGTFAVALTGCGIAFANMFAMLENNNQKLACYMNEPFFSITFNSDGHGGAKLQHTANASGIQTVALNVVSSSLNNITGETAFQLSNGAIGTIEQTNGACVNDMSGQISDYTIMFSDFGAMGNQPALTLPIERQGCCRLVQ